METGLNNTGLTGLTGTPTQFHIGNSNSNYLLNLLNLLFPQETEV